MSERSFSFAIKHAHPSGARVGVIDTPHGSFNTPAFVTVGTKATVKAVLPDDLKKIAGAEVALANTYHLFLQPGEDVVAEAGLRRAEATGSGLAKAGGLHAFMGWDGPLITDSGGFQVFSLGVGFGKGVSKFVARKEEEGMGGLALYDDEVRTQHGKLAIVDDEGVSFTSHLDGTLYRFTPERSIEIQHKLGADIFFAFDDFVSPDAPREEQITSMRRTHAWAERSLKTHRGNLEARKRQAMFGIVQGGRYADLRQKSAEEIGGMGFDGIGIGGTFSKADLGDTLRAAILPLPSSLPRHLLGIGEPEDIFEAVARGIDSFDCVQPTRLARNGTIYTARGKVNILNEKYIRDFSPLDLETGGYMSEKFSKAYLAHLFRAKEMLGATIASLHNLYFLTSLMKDIRESILEDRFEAFRQSFLEKYLSNSSK